MTHKFVEDYQLMWFKFLDEDIMVLEKGDEFGDKEKWTLVFDGSSNAISHRFGEILISPKSQYIPFT